MADRRTKKVTISQVAALAGVSVGTVSNYLNGTAAVSGDRSARIQAAIDTLHFTPDAAASSLRRKDIREIIVLTPDLNNTFYTNIIRSYMDCANRDGYHIRIASYEYSGKAELDALQSIKNARENTLVVIFNGFDDEEMIERLIKSGKRVILADRICTIAGASSLSFDNEKVLFELVGLLKSKGYRRIALFTEPPILQNIQKRHDSFLKAMKFHGYAPEDTLVYLDQTLVLNKMKQGYHYMRELLKKTDPGDLPQAFVASSDNLAIGILRALTEAGYRIPEDFGLTGFDNLDISEFTVPALTTVNQDREHFGRKLWTISKKVLKTNECINEVLPQNLVIRASC